MKVFQSKPLPFPFFVFHFFLFCGSNCKKKKGAANAAPSEILYLRLAPGVSGCVPTKICDGVNEELSDISGIVDISVGFFNTGLVVVGGLEQFGIKTSKLVAIIDFTGAISDAIPIFVFKPVGVGVAVIDNRYCENIGCIVLDLGIQCCFKNSDLGFERFFCVSVGIVIGSRSWTDTAELELGRVIARIGL